MPSDELGASSLALTIADFDSLGTGILVLAPNGPTLLQVRAVNQRARELLGAHGATPGAPLEALMGPALAGRMQSAAHECQERRHMIEMELQLPPAPGGRWLRLALAPLQVPGAPGSVVVTLSDVSGRKKAESRTLASELKFEGLVQGSIQGILVVRGGRALFCNAASVAILGFADAAQVMALPDLSELVHPDDREAVQAGYAEVVAGRGAAQRLSYRALRRDGAAIWLEVFPSRVLWEGEPALQLTLHDVTERHQAARSLQESEERYRTLVEHAQVSIVVRRDGRALFANNQAVRDAGFASFEDCMRAMGSGLPLPLASEAHRSTLLEALERIQRGELASHSYEGSWLRSDGKTMHYSSLAHRILWQGQPAVLTTLLDRSEQVRLDQELRHKEALLRSVVTHLPVILWAVDAQGTITLSEGKGLAAQGFTPGELVGRSIFDVYAEHPGLLDGFRRMLGGEAVTSVDETRGAVFERRMEPIHAPDGTVAGAIGVSVDITEHRRAQETLRASEERYRALVESAEIGITVHVDGRGVFINDYQARLLGYAEPQAYLNAVAGAAPLLHIGTERRAHALDGLLRVQSGEQEVFVDEGTLIRNDGRLLHIHSTSRRILWEGRPAVLTAILDVTERAALEEGLRRGEERYRTLVDGSLQGIAVFGAGDFRARFVNGAMLRLAGVKAAADYVGTVRLFDNIAEPYAKSLRERIAHLLAGGSEHVQDELPVRRHDGAVYWAEFQARRLEWDGEPAVQLTVLDVTDRKRAEEALKERQSVLTRQNEYFRQDISRRRERAEKGLVAESAAMRRVLREAELVARSRVSVLIEGETGSGKEVVAEFLHRHSDRADHLLSVVNCGALSENLMDAELFGHEKGAFTGASDARAGMIEIADRGTLFLDEIGDLPPSGQVRLLRFLEKGVIRRVGSTRERKVDVRILAATHKSLKALVAAGTFREDLYHRLMVILLEVPPLRERIEDILPLAQLFVERYCAEAHLAPRTLSDEARLALTSYGWPGNVRELSHTIQRAVLAAQLDGIDVITTNDLGLPVHDAADSVLLPIKEVMRRAEHRHVMTALRYFNGNRKRAAESLGISLRHLYRLLD